jgi:hypothetical protein
MEVGWHYAVVSDNQVFILAKNELFVPRVGSEFQIRLGERFAIDLDHTSSEEDLFAGQADHALEEQSPFACDSDCHYVAAFGRSGAVGKPVHEIDLAVMVSRHHADTGHTHRDKDDSEQDCEEQTSCYEANQGDPGVAAKNEATPPGKVPPVRRSVVHETTIGGSIRHDLWDANTRAAPD